MNDRIVSLCRRVTEALAFTRFITAVILANAAAIGAETYSWIADEYGAWLVLSDRVFLSIFIAEIAMKIIACGKRPFDFFKSGWNAFDFIIIAAALLPGLQAHATILRLVRLLRVLRLLSALPGLQVLVVALVHSVPKIGQMSLLAALLFYIYAVIGQTLFAAHDPTHWGNLHTALLSLFRVMTLEDWTDLMYTAMQLHSWSWAFFVSFVLFGTFIVFNMLIGIVLSSMDDAKRMMESRAAHSANVAGATKPAVGPRGTRVVAQANDDELRALHQRIAEMHASLSAIEKALHTIARTKN